MMGSESREPSVLFNFKEKGGFQALIGFQFWGDEEEGDSMLPDLTCVLKVGRELIKTGYS